MTKTKQQPLGVRLTRILKMLAAEHKTKFDAHEKHNKHLRDAFNKPRIAEAAKILGIPKARVTSVYRSSNFRSSSHDLSATLTFANGITGTAVVRPMTDDEVDILYSLSEAYPEHLRPCAFRSYLDVTEMNNLKKFFRARYERSNEHYTLSDDELKVIVREWLSLKGPCKL